MRYSHSFYLDLLGLLSNKFPDFTWGEDDLGYYWKESNKEISKVGFESLQDLVESISGYLSL